MATTPRDLRSGRYAVVRPLAEGGQASTFEAVDKRDGRPVVLKRFRVHGAASWKEVELAEREAKVLAGLHHPALPTYVEHFEEGGELYLVTEKIEGESLAALRQRGARLDEGELLRFVSDAAAVLDYLHRQSPPVIHRDIKPSNVMRRPDGSFALIDFGSVRDSLRGEDGSTVVGTFGYMAPEQFQGRAMPATDVYAVGATALCLATGVDPSVMPHRGLAIDVVAALQGSRLSPAFGRLVGAALEPDPDRRPTTLRPLVQAYEAELGAGGSPRRGGGRRRGGAAGPGPSLGSPPPSPSMPLLPKLFVLALMLGLTLAQVALAFLLGGVLPLLLRLLSVPLGPLLRSAAGAVEGASRGAFDYLGQSRDALWQAAFVGAPAEVPLEVPLEAPVEVPPVEVPPRVRVATPPVEPPPPEALEDDEPLEEEPPPRRRAWWR